MFKFEEKIDIIDLELEKKRNKWYLTARNDIDYNDVKQIIRIHIWKKWDKWDQKKPIGPWLNSIINNQISNILRNNYTSFISPCNKCPANQGGESCSIYGRQCKDCPLFAKWEKGKKRAFNVKVPVSIERFFNLDDIFSENLNYEESTQKIHKGVLKRLNAHNKKIYKMLYIEHRDDKYVAKKMGFKEDSRPGRFKVLEGYKKNFVQIAKEVIREELF